MLALAIAVAAASTPPATVRGWTIEDAQGACTAVTAYEPDIVVTLLYDPARNTAAFQISSPRWNSIQKDARYPLRIDFSNDRYYSTAEAKGYSLEAGSRHAFGVVTYWTGLEFLADFAMSQTMEISVSGTRLDRFSLNGTRDMVRRLVACAERSFRANPGDPFRTVRQQSSTATSSGAAPNRPARLRSGSISNEDYPAVAIRGGAQGTTRVTIQISASGAVTSCSVSGSSGSSALDTAACNLVQRRYRYEPAMRDGVAVASSASTSIMWRLPVDAAPAGDTVPASEAIPPAPHPSQPLQPESPRP